MAQDNLTPTLSNTEFANKESTTSFTRIYDKIVLTLENSLIPPSKLEETPSRLDGLDAEVEKDLRILGCELIQTAGILLKLPQVAMATGQVLFQRFFYSKSFVLHNMETVAMSCVCLASKIEEAQRRIRDVINVFNHIKQVRAQKEITPLILDQYYTNLKNQVIKAERRVLKELGFCVHVKHPHKLIVLYLQVLKYEKHEKIMQMSWNFMNDSLRTDVFMRYQPETIACACIYLSARRLGIALPSHPQPWFGIFNVREDDILDICYRVMDLYRRPKANIEKLEAAVDELKKQHAELRNKTKESVAATPPTTAAITEKTNGSHNAWGGFIQRTIPDQNPKIADKVVEEKKHISKSHSSKSSLSSRSNSRSRSSSHSRSRSRSQTTSHDDGRSHKKKSLASVSNSNSSSESTAQIPSSKQAKRAYHHHPSNSSSSPRVKRRSFHHSQSPTNSVKNVSGGGNERRKRKSSNHEKSPSGNKKFGKHDKYLQDEKYSEKDKYYNRDKYMEREKYEKYHEREKHYDEKYQDREKYNNEKYHSREKYYDDKYQDREKYHDEKHQDREKYHDEKHQDREKYDEKHQDRDNYHEKYQDRDKYYDDKYRNRDKYYDEKQQDHEKHYDDKYLDREKRRAEKYQDRDKYHDDKYQDRDKYYEREKYSNRKLEREKYSGYSGGESSYHHHSYHHSSYKSNKQQVVSNDYSSSQRSSYRDAPRESSSASSRRRHHDRR